MGAYQVYKGNAEQKKFFLIDKLIGGLNTEFSDDTSYDGDFSNLINFNIDTKGTLYKRKGFGKQSALSEILKMLPDMPSVKGKSAENPFPEQENDNLVYVKLLKNDNGVFRNLAAFVGDYAYRKYQEAYGWQNNTFEIMMLSTNQVVPTSKYSTAWLIKCTLPELKYDPDTGAVIDTIQLEQHIYELPVVLSWDKNLFNIDTIEYSDKIYMTSNNKGLIEFDRNNDSFNYYGKDIPNQSNKAYKPTSMEVRKIGFNMLGDDPLYWVNYENITTDSIQGIYITSSDNPRVPTLNIPFGGKFRLNILYTGANNGFTLEFKSGENKITHTANKLVDQTGLICYDIELKDAPSGEVEIKIMKTSATIDPYYDYYPIAALDPLAKEVNNLNIGGCNLVEMYNRAVYYKDDTIWFSEPNNFNYIPNYNYIVLPIEPTDKITKIVFFRNVYIIFTKYRIYKMIGAFGANDFQLMPVNASIGCHAPNTVIPVENELYFASPRGLYALRSSEFREGIENLKELDAKIKSVTSDFSLYVGDLANSAIRYNGISERAHAVRYKDTYTLYFNTALETGDWAATQDLDALVYRYDLKTFALTRHLIKPPFMFFVDGAIECYCTAPEKEEYTERKTLLEYNFETSTGRTITDLSGNGYNAELVGAGANISPGRGMIFNGTNSFIRVANIPASVDLESGFAIEFDAVFDDINSLNTLMDFSQSQATGSGSSKSFSLWTDWSNGYRGELLCVSSPNATTGVDTINWTFRYHRDGYGRNQAYSGNFRLKNYNGVDLISQRGFSFNFGGGLYTDVASGSFTVQHDTNGNYMSSWVLWFNSAYPSTGVDIGGATSGGGWGNTGWTGAMGMWFNWSANANASGANLRIDIYDHFEYGATLAVGARTDNYCKGVNYYAPAVSKTGSAAANIYLNSIDYWYGYSSGQPVLGIDGSHNVKATIAGVYRAYITGSIGGVVLPYINHYTVWNWFDVTNSTIVTLPKISYPSKRTISVFSNANSNGYTFNTISEFSSSQVDTVGSGVSILERHKVLAIYSKNGTNFDVKIYIDDILKKQTTIPTTSVKNTLRDSCFIGRNQDGTSVFRGKIYNYRLSLYRNNAISTPVVAYDFSTGSGNTIYDKSGNGYNGTITGATWLTDTGLQINGLTSYVKLPNIDDDVRFANGFTIEFEIKPDNAVKPVKIMDLAIEYNTGKASNEKASINIGLDTNTKTISLMSTSLNYKGWLIKQVLPNINNRIKYSMSCVDNGSSGYDVSIMANGTLINKDFYGYGSVTNVLRRSNFLCKSNNPDDGAFNGMLYNFKIIIHESENPVPIYSSSIYEYETTYDDFNKPIAIELETKGANLQYPQHIKKLKSIMIKGTGGFAYQQQICEVIVDGHVVNDPKVYRCYIDNNHQVVYDYDIESNLGWDERISLLGSMRLDHTRLGETTYETRKIIAPAKGRNFAVKIYGESSDFLGIESFGFIFKLGKVKEG